MQRRSVVGLDRRRKRGQKRGRFCPHFLHFWGTLLRPITASVASIRKSPALDYLPRLYTRRQGVESPGRFRPHFPSRSRPWKFPNLAAQFLKLTRPRAQDLRSRGEDDFPNFRRTKRQSKQALPWLNWVSLGAVCHSKSSVGSTQYRWKSSILP